MKDPRFWDPKVDAPRLIYSVCNGQPTKVRSYTVVSGVTTTSGLGVYNNTIQTVERALLERYFMVKTPNGFQQPLVPQPKVYEGRGFTRFKKLVVDKVRPVATVLSEAEVVALYTGPKRRIYENAMISLSREKLNKRDAKVRPFAKYGKDDLGKAPRIINPRTPRYNLTAARYLKKAEKQMYKAINHAFGKASDFTVIKGLDCYESARVIRSKWELFSNPVAVGLDATKWDAHVSRAALEYEHEFYNDVFYSRLLLKLLTWQLLNRGRAYCDDGTVDIIMEGTRCSGDINTSMGNCILACALVWVYCDRIGIKAELCNNGDDCVIIMEESDLAKFLSGVHNFYNRCGFRIEVEKPVYTFEQIDFCQTRPVFDGQRWRMMRNPLACFKKDGMCLVPLSNSKTFRKWMGAIGECGLAAASGLPVLQSWYNMFLRNGRNSSKKFRNHLFAHTIYGTNFAKGLGKAKVTEITEDARVSFFNATGITPDLQVAYEQVYDSFTITDEFGVCGENYDSPLIPIIDLAPVILSN